MSKPEDKQDEKDAVLEAFGVAVDKLFEVEWGGEQSDHFGGQLLFVYRPPGTLEGCRLAEELQAGGVAPEKIPGIVAAAYTLFDTLGQKNIQRCLIELMAGCVLSAVKAAGETYTFRLLPDGPAPPGRRLTSYNINLHGGAVVRTQIKRGKLSQWESEELRRGLADALALLPRPRRNYENVHLILKGIYGEDVPETPEALRKVIERAEIDWRALKTDIS